LKEVKVTGVGVGVVKLKLRTAQQRDPKTLSKDKVTRQQVLTPWTQSAAQTFSQPRTALGSLRVEAAVACQVNLIPPKL